ncbi:hypothetical protein V474_02710 [Novosphingobium barchaimii LL02]|uniref:EF-hand domain-containing protein n=1 Tax=Novosphingobium barchaimii LL02 TaxID=1114963 RepID=A0A0J7XJU6_9SPHN|nr:EF-hand domain-containing protein [Novosphingobium barchaimii]KMS51977.1 hypothetical protein V474_02710 [Novosphingobium barchaimii LL02]
MKYLACFAVLALGCVDAASAQTDDAFNTYVDAGFAAMDTDKNGNVDRTEFAAFMRKRLAQQGAEFDAAFTKLDKNADGSLSKAEAAAGNPLLAEHFSEVDTNKDGALSKDELRAAMIAAQTSQAAAQ